jgi:DNA polymerase-3 subunit beta
MSVRDLVLVSLGEIILMLTFGLGIMVGISLTRKDSRHGDSNEDEGEDWRISSTAGELLDALAAVMRAVPGHTPKPILQNVRIGDGLISGTDLEVRIDREIGQHCEPFLVPAARLLQILRSVRVTPRCTSCQMRRALHDQGRWRKWEIPTESAVEFPSWEPTEAKPVCRMPADQFVRAIKAVAYATDQESSRFAIGAVLVEVADGNATLVATDGRRLSCVEVETDQAVDDSTTLIPARAIRLMATLATGTEGSVQLEATKSEVVCTTDGGNDHGPARRWPVPEVA